MAALAQAPAVQKLIAALQHSGGRCHLLGLVSPGGVHAHQAHAVALARIMLRAGIPVCVHVFTDGRDTPPRSGAEAVERLRTGLPDGAAIATVSGRYYAMDRDHRWDRVSRAFEAIVHAAGPGFADAASVLDDAYGRDITDEFVVPCTVGNYAGMQDGDGLLSFNFRADRIRELLTPMVDPGFDGFARTMPKLAGAVGMTRYSDGLAPFMDAIFAPQSMSNILGEIVSGAGRRQIRLAETEKYPHVTYFFNGGREAPYPGEERVMVPSPKVATYDLQPEMSAPELTAQAVTAIGSGQFDLVVLNFANPDMVGHTGSLQAAIAAVEAVDAGLGRIAAAIEAQGGALLITADHGNAEMMRDPDTGAPHTAHTTNVVPVLLAAPGGLVTALRSGRLADLAPTLLALMGVAQPDEMTGSALILICWD